jgi:hypothetical protein
MVYLLRTETEFKTCFNIYDSKYLLKEFVKIIYKHIFPDDGEKTVFRFSFVEPVQERVCFLKCFMPWNPCGTFSILSVYHFR